MAVHLPGNRHGLCVYSRGSGTERADEGASGSDKKQAIWARMGPDPDLDLDLHVLLARSTGTVYLWMYLYTTRLPEISLE